MKKNQLLLLLVLIIIGISCFFIILDKNTVESFRNNKSTRELVKQPCVIATEDDVEVVIIPHVLYNYLPKVNVGTVVHHQYYSLSYNEDYEQAEWVAYSLNSTFRKGNTKRASSFYKDLKVESGSAHKDDYKYSGYDRGHLLPAGDRKMSKSAMRETFYMSNISPQDPGLNRKGWKYLEERIRDKSDIYDSLYIVTGPIISEKHEEIGDNRVAVPVSFYKIILNYTNTSELCATAFIFPNHEVSRLSLDYIVTVDSLEQATGIDFFHHLPINIQDSFESSDCLQLLD